MTVFYNEVFDKSANFTKLLVEEGHIPYGVVDTRSIEDIRPSELRIYTQCHFFCGLAGWPYALREAGIPDDFRVWTGSCPCRPFSKAGQRKGFDDDRHLWPAFFWHIRQCKPDFIFGEQVASSDARVWLDLVFNDLENAGYTCGAVSAVACGFGAFQERERIYWVAYTDKKRSVWQHALLRAQNNKWSEDISEATWGGQNEWIERFDGKGNVFKSPVECGLESVVDGSSENLELCGIYGDAIVIPQAVHFIRSFIDVCV